MANDLPVTELADFAIQNYNGSIVSVNIEDLRFISRQADAAADNTFYHQNKNLRFVYLNAARLLVLDESRPLVKKLAQTYNISLAPPVLANFEFALAFIKKGVTPAPAAIKLSEALQQVGYSGPLITKLEQISMYVVAFGSSV
jgi:hypothetical protein